MIIKRRIFEKYPEFKFSIPYGLGDRVLVTEGKKISKNTELITSAKSNRKHSFYVPEQIGCSINDIAKTLNCIDGEYVNRGDILAQKIVAGGLKVRKLISPCSAIVDLSRIDQGYVDLLGEEKDILLKSNFAGTVDNVNSIDGLCIRSSAIALDILSISDIFENGSENRQKKITGEFVVLSEGKDLLLESNEESYHNKIVFAGKYLHIKLLHDLFEKGASFILTYSMNYEDFRRQGLPIGVLGGFGEIHSSNQILNEIGKMNGTFAVIEYSESQIFFLTDKGFQSTVNKDMFLENLIGANVKSLYLSNYGMVGKITSVEEESVYVTVLWENGSTSILNVGGLEFISF